MNEALRPEEKRPRVLHIEESSGRRALVREALTREGFEVSEAPDGIAGIRRAVAERPDLILVDLHLPILDGYEVASRLRGHHELDATPIVAWAEAQGDRTLSLSVGCDGYLEGALDAGRLPEQLREFLAGKKERLQAGLERQRLREYSAALVERLERTVEEHSSANERLRAQARARVEFMQRLSHELATPLTPLVGYLKILRSGRLGALTPQQQNVVEAMSQSGERLGRHIDNLVDFVALETGQYRVHRSPFDLTAMLNACLADLLAKARAKRVRLDSRLPERLVVLADERKLRQAVSNLLDNAIRFSPHGGNVLLTVEEGRDQVTVSLYDQGPGLPPEAASRMLVPLGASPVEGAERTAGLGLPVASQIVRAHGGTLWIESPPKNQPEVREQYSGTKVAFTFPTHAETTTPPHTDSEGASPESPAR